MTFQKTIIRTFFLMSTQARHEGDFTIQKYNPHIDKFNPVVRLQGIILDISNDYCKTYSIVKIDDDFILDIDDGVIQYGQKVGQSMQFCVKILFK